MCLEVPFYIQGELLLVNADYTYYMAESALCSCYMTESALCSPYSGEVAFSELVWLWFPQSSTDHQAELSEARKFREG